MSEGLACLGVNRNLCDHHVCTSRSQLFTAFNGVMWKARQSIRQPGSFDFMADPTVNSAAGHNPAFRVMDVWPMSAKRADAHMGRSSFTSPRLASDIDLVTDNTDLLW